MIIAKDVMTHSPFTLFSSDSLQTAVSLFSKNRLTTVPVITPGQEILGVLSETALLKAYIADRRLTEGTSLLAEQKDLLQPPIIVHEREPIEKVVQSVFKATYHRVLVVDSLDHLVGVISPKDLLAFLISDGEPSISLQQELRDLRDQVQSRKKIEKDLRDVESQIRNLKRVIETSNFMLHSVDHEGKILMANSRLHAVLGYNEGELVGKNLSDLYPSHIVKEAERGLNKIRESGGHDLVYTVFKKKNGDTIKVEVASTAVLDEKGQFVATSTMSRVIDPEALLRVLHGVFK